MLVLAWATMLLAAAPAQRLPTTIDAIVDGSSVAANSWSMLIENADGSIRYYERAPDLGLAPASNTKLFTTIAAFGILGPSFAFESRVFTEGTLTSGALAGNLNLVVEHDITWNDSTLSNPRAGLNRIAQRVKSAGINSISGSVRVYGRSSYDLGQFDDIRNTSAATLNATTAVNFRDALIAAGVSVAGGSSGQSGFTAPGTLLLTYLSSEINTIWSGGTAADLDGACIGLNRISHNPMADMLLRAIGYQVSGNDSLASGSAAVRAWLAATAGVDTAGIIMNDGSGLSHGNRFTARQTIGVLRYAFANFPTFENTLSINGVSGTLAGRVPQLPAGSVKGKTGSLSISIATSGVVINPVDGERYLFSLLSNRTSIDQTATRSTMDLVITEMGQRGLPNAPVLQLARNDANGDSITMVWENPGDQTRFLVHESATGAPASFTPIADLTFPVAETAFYTRTGLAPGTTRYFRITSRNGAAESKPSDVYGARVATSPSPVLIVDGNDRWQSQTGENPGAASHDFAARVGRGVDLWAFDTAANEALPSNRFATLNNYTAALWLLGEESTADETFSDAEQALVADYLDAHAGRLLHSGAETGWDLFNQGGTNDRAFFNNVLRAGFVADLPTPLTTIATGVSGQLYEGLGPIDFGNGPLTIGFPDVYGANNGSVRALDYNGTQAAGITYRASGVGGGGPRVIGLGLPLENVGDEAARGALVARSLDFFFPPAAPAGARTLGAGGVLLNWDPNGERDLLGYNVYRGAQSGSEGSSPLNGAPLTTPSFLDSTAPDGVPSYYFVTAVDRYDLESAPSAEVVGVPGEITAPMLLLR